MEDLRHKLFASQKTQTRLLGIIHQVLFLTRADIYAYIYSSHIILHNQKIILKANKIYLNTKRIRLLEIFKRRQCLIGCMETFGYPSLYLYVDLHLFAKYSSTRRLLFLSIFLMYIFFCCLRLWSFW